MYYLTLICTNIYFLVNTNPWSNFQCQFKLSTANFTSPLNNFKAHDLSLP